MNTKGEICNMNQEFKNTVNNGEEDISKLIPSMEENKKGCCQGQSKNKKEGCCQGLTFNEGCCSSQIKQIQSGCFKEKTGCFKEENQLQQCCKGPNQTQQGPCYLGKIHQTMHNVV